MPLTHLVRISCCNCRTVAIMEATLSFVFGEIVTTPRLVNAWLMDNDEYFCGIVCKGASDKKKPVIKDEPA